LRERLRRAEASGAATLVLDLRAVTFLDSTGIWELVAAHQRARATGRRLVVVRGARTPVGHVLEMTAAEQALETAETPAALDGSRQA
jgi:anti-sigma B factor antagonist